MAVSRSLISYTEDLGDGNVAVHGADDHGNTAIVHCGLDKVHDGSVYLMLDAALGKVRQTRLHLRQADTAERTE